MGESTDRPTTLELLAAVERGIKKLAEGAQSYSIGGRQFTRANLRDLTDLRDQLRRDLNREDAEAQGFTGSRVVEFD